MIRVRPVESDADLEVWAAIKSAVVPEEPVTAEQLRRSPGRQRLLLLADLDGESAGCGIASRSDDPERGFVMARVLSRRRHGAAATSRRARGDARGADSRRTRRRP